MSRITKLVVGSEGHLLDRPASSRGCLVIGPDAENILLVRKQKVIVPFFLPVEEGQADQMERALVESFRLLYCCEPEVIFEFRGRGLMGMVAA